MGAASPPLVLDVGAYCGGSALRLAGCLPGAPLFQFTDGCFLKWWHPQNTLK